MDIRRKVAVLTLAASLLPASAGAQTPQSPDPEAGSPAGAQYEIPVDRARDDAAPRSKGGRGSGAGGGSTSSSGGSSRATPSTGSGASGAAAVPTPGSTLRSENGRGSSSRVPGTSGDSDGGGSGSSKGSDDGSGSGSSRGTLDDSSGSTGTTRPIAASTASEDGPAVSRGMFLLALCALLGGGIGLLARRSHRAG